jgi:hypothetical protein
MEKKLEFKHRGGRTKKVELDINYYMNNHCIYLGLISGKGANRESYADITVNLSGTVPDYCGYLDTNRLPELEEFVQKNGIGEFTGLTKQSGFCVYPLYLIHVEKLRELCPAGMLAYEQKIGRGSSEKKEEKKKNR